MSTLYKLTTPVFSPYFNGNAAQDTVVNSILQLRIVWTPSQQTTTMYDLAPGDTVLTDVTLSGNGIILTMIARDPLRSDIYYSGAFTFSAEQYAIFVPSGSDSLTDASGKVFMVLTEGYGITGIGGVNSYLLFDYSAWAATTVIPTLVEPFNVLFTPYVEPNSTLTIQDGTTSITISSGGSCRLTNTPWTGGGSTRLPDYGWTTSDNALGIAGADIVTTTQLTTGLIRSINGVTPENGNINIQVLTND